jgi:hypothetical protein
MQTLESKSNLKFDLVIHAIQEREKEEEFFFDFMEPFA